MKLNVALIALLALVALVTMPVQAQTITLSNPGAIAERDIMVYFPNGTMQGFYNSTSVIEIDNTSDYIFTMKPLSSNFIDDPGDYLVNTALPFITNNVAPLVVAFVL